MIENNQSIIDNQSIIENKQSIIESINQSLKYQSINH